jgi:hypothetical protein
VRRRAGARRAAALCAWLAAVPAAGHPLAPSLLELEEGEAGRVVARLAAPRVAGAGRVEVGLPERCRAAGPPRAWAEADRLVSEQVLDCGRAGLAGAEIAARGLAATGTDLLLHVERASGRAQQALLTAARPSLRLPERASSLRVGADYARLGAEHLAGGLDHLLFVAGLFLLGGGPRRLVGALSAFTLGHSATLGLVALGVASPPAALVEIGIAASLVAQALALAARARAVEPQRAAARGPWRLAAGFGLLHGMGFAGALREVGLPEHAVPEALLAFNVGIELAQLGFVALLAGAARGLAALRVPAGRWPAHALGGLGAFLVLDRLAAWLLPS